METKARIRREILALRDAMTGKERYRKSKEIMARAMDTLWYKEADIVLAYISYRSEVETESLIQDALSQGKKVYCPKVEGDEMNFYEIFSMQDVEEGYCGIREPQGKKERKFVPGLARGGKCLMILPGSAFDEERNRMGYGKGYYDRYLERNGDGCGGIKLIGVCFSCQLQKRIPADSYDKKADMVITERDII